MNQQLSVNTVPTISSREIAELCGKQHKNVLRDIRTIFEEVGISQLNFERTYFDVQGKERIEYALPRRECDLIITSYSAKYRLKIIDRWHELEAQAHTSMPVISDPHTALLVAQVIELDKVKQTLKVQENRLTQIELQIDSNIDYMTISAYAKSIGLKCPTSVARSYGKIAVAVSKKKGINVGQVSDERWGVVKTYHINVLKEVFKD